jgi:hypothetical protein
MTPARRRKIVRGIILVVVIVVLCFLNNLMFLYRGLPWDQKLAAVLMGRRPGSMEAGTSLIRVALAQPPKEGKPLNPSEWMGLRVDAKPASRPTRVSFERIGKWTFVEGKSSIPADVQELNGKEVEISGLMMPMNQVNVLNQFILVQSLWGCCFGKVPAPNHIIVVTVKPGRVVEYCPDPIKVTGGFSVGETREGGKLVSVYRMEADTVVVR